MRKPRLLDLFCGAGGAAMGYYRAGFDVVGVDINPQPRYPFEFVQASRDEISFSGFDAIHASPPCQRYSSITETSGARLLHKDLIAPVRDLLELLGAPYVIENVPRAPLRQPVLLCGAERGLRLGPYVLRRHRMFEASFSLWSRGCGCYPGDGTTMGVYGGEARVKPRGDGAGGKTYKGSADQRRLIMDMPWATQSEVNEAIPPAYTEWVGLQLLSAMRAAE